MSETETGSQCLVDKGQIVRSTARAAVLSVRVPSYCHCASRQSVPTQSSLSRVASFSKALVFASFGACQFFASVARNPGGAPIRKSL